MVSQCMTSHHSAFLGASLCGLIALHELHGALENASWNFEGKAVMSCAALQRLISTSLRYKQPRIAGFLLAPL